MEALPPDNVAVEVDPQEDIRCKKLRQQINPVFKEVHTNEEQVKTQWNVQKYQAKLIDAIAASRQENGKSNTPRTLHVRSGKPSAWSAAFEPAAWSAAFVEFFFGDSALSSNLAERRQADLRRRERRQEERLQEERNTLAAVSLSWRCMLWLAQYDGEHLELGVDGYKQERHSNRKRTC